jgi:hypothetical protein
LNKNVSFDCFNILRLFKTNHPICKDVDDELFRLEGVDDALDETRVGLDGHVALEADVGTFRLWSYVDRHVFALHLKIILKGS